MPVGINLSKKPRNASGSPMSSVYFIENKPKEIWKYLY